ncbi:coiled-coil domain-containing protein [Metabacillus iocasae]|uniref:Peptidoglycan hydrolase CwlO-like protein n=1 Tax=Priestia iocasae TaxID=2291674 RepID=A0ABS2QW89_9BACI|nr:C40 family peptidase [Metabacillus iocasae]MBM7703751.1 peptidoglycan hydrolase CwlO-like protein [Metabacillus iocasae]
MKKSIILFHTTALLGISFLFSHFDANAESLTNMNRKKEQVQQQLKDTQLNLTQTVDEIHRLQDEQQLFIQQIKRLELALEANEEQIRITENQMMKKTVEIETVQKDLSVLQEKFQKRYHLLEERAKSFHESGGNISYIDVLLGASSFSNFVDRAIAVATIAKADQQLLNQTQIDQKILKEKQLKVERKLEELQYMKTELDGMMVQFNEQKNHQHVYIAQVKVEEKEQTYLKMSLEEKEEALSQRNTVIQQEIQQEKQRLEKESKQTVTLTQSYHADIPMTGSGNVSEVVTVGNKWIGHSAYVFGGGRNSYDIANGLFDCSAFVHWAYSQVGIKLGPLGSVSTETLKHVGKQVLVRDIKPGDLVFFDTYKIDGHVGIYVGNGTFIGSQSSTGVAIADMTKGYYKQKFNGRVRRI